MSDNGNAALMKAYNRYLRLQRGFSPNTLEAYQRDVKKLTDYLDGEGIKLTDVTLEHLQSFAASLHDLGIGAKSQCRILSGVRSFCNFMVRDGRIEDDPSELLESPQTGKHLPEVLSIEEVDMLEAAIDCTKWEGQRNRAMIEMLFSCGLRVSELVNLKLSDLYLDERFIRVLGKGNKERIVYFDARTKIHLQNYLSKRKDNNPALFVSLKTPYDRLKIGGVEARLRNLGKQLGLNKVHPHKFRRTLATMAIDKGMPIEQLQKLLGHSKIDTTLQYAMVKQSNVKIAHRKYIG